MISSEPLAEPGLQTMLDVATTAARLAGAVVRRLYARPHDVTVKGLRDIVTEADLAAERLILQEIRTHFPAHHLVSEEATPDPGELEGGITWAVDPLDGTTNYARGFPFFSISIAALAEGRPIVGVVYDPLREMLFSARRGGGAFLNGVALRPSPMSDLMGAMVAFDWPRDEGQRQEVWTMIGRLAHRVGTLRNVGSAALGLCYVAAGWVDAYFNRSLGLWDVAAASLLLEEVGGQFTQANGSAWEPAAHTCLGTNGWLHRALVELLARE
jgi:myo-inositol-1(or 4)-monophosphatase